MTRLERSSKRKCEALRKLVESGEFSASFALLKLEDYYDDGKVIDADYDELSEWLEELLNPPIEEELEDPIEEGE